MGDNSFTSILILLAMFIVLPTVLKFIGQYTLGSKNTDNKPDESEPADTGSDLTEYREDQQHREDFDDHVRTPVSQKPIKPKWF